jgi:four helix bundle protein
MSTIKCFEDLEIWKLSRTLARNVYSDFKARKDYNFVTQITSASLSIMNNIAEGFGRESDKEFDYFLNISKGSANEVKSMYYLATDLNYVSLEVSEQRRKDAQMIINSISKLRNYLRKK